MAVIDDLRCHATGPILQFRHGGDQGIHARDEGGSCALGRFRLFGRAVGATGYQFGRGLHIAAGRRAVAVEQFGLVLHSFAGASQLTVNAAEPGFQLLRLRV